MSLEHQNADGHGESVPGDRGRAPAAFGEAWGWELTQRDWSLRAREPARPGASALTRMVARIDAALVRAWRLIRGAMRGNLRGTALASLSPPGGGGSGTPRSSARPPSSRGR